MKILVLSDLFPPHGIGGAGEVAYRFAKQYKKQGHEVIVITTVQKRQDEGVEESEGFRIYNVYADYNERWRAYLGLYNHQTVSTVREVLIEEKPDVIHSHNIHCYLSYHCLKIAHDLGIPVVLTLHDAMSFDYGKFTQFVNPNDLSNDPDVNYRINPWITLKTYRFRYFPLRNFFTRVYLNNYVAKMVAVSNELKKALNANGINCTEVVHNGVDLGEFQVEEAKVKDFRKAHGLEGKKAVLFAGRLSYLKGGEHIVKAMKYVCEKVGNATLLVLGRKEGYAEHMKELATNLRIGNNIVLTGWISGENLKAAYGASDIVVSPSICWDSFPMVNLEAMAMKKPVVATCFGGSKEIVVDGVTGYIVNPLNVEMMAEKITELLIDEEKARRMGEAGYRRVAEKFTIQMQAPKMLGLFSEVIKASS